MRLIDCRFSSTRRSLLPPLRRGATARAFVLAAALALSGCASAINPDLSVVSSTPVTDLDTAKPPPQTVTSTPLLPPMPDVPAAAPSPVGSLPPAGDLQQTPIPYDQLYSDDEQARIQSELAAAAAKARWD